MGAAVECTHRASPMSAERSETMSDRDDEPTDLFDAVCRLDDLAEWLTTDWPEEAERLRDLSRDLKGFIVISLKRTGGADE